LRERAQKLHETTDYAVVLSAGAGPVHLGQWMRGFGEWLTDLLENPAFIEALMDRIADYWVAVVDRALKEAGDFIDIVCWGDDLGTQHGPQVSPDLYRRLIKPWHKRMVEAVKRHGKPVHYHTCGSVVTLLADFIDLGIDVLNPVQVSATGMDTRRLRKEFGHEIAFWGAIDTQAVLPRGTPEDVRNEVKRRLTDLAPGGGYVLCAVHNIQPEVPPENIEAMYQAALEFGRY
jgi:uroporphyrinogen decarboxylase